MSVKLDSSLKVIYNSLTLSRLFYLFSIFLLPFSFFRPVFLPLPSIVIPLLLSILGLIFSNKRLYFRTSWLLLFLLFSFLSVFVQNLLGLITSLHFHEEWIVIYSFSIAYFMIIKSAIFNDRLLAPLSLSVFLYGIVSFLIVICLSNGFTLHSPKLLGEFEPSVGNIMSLIDTTGRLTIYRYFSFDLQVVDPNHLGFLMGFCSLLLLNLLDADLPILFLSHKYIRFLFYLSLLILCLLVLFLTQSRSSMLSLIVSTALIYSPFLKSFLLKFNWKFPAFQFYNIMFVLITVTALLLFTFFLKPELVQRIFARYLTFSSNYQYFSILFSKVKLLMGKVVHDLHSTVYPSFSPQCFAFGCINPIFNPHNEFLLILKHFGLLPLIFYVKYIYLHFTYSLTKYSDLA